MASTSSNIELEASTSTSMPAFVKYNPPATKLAFRSDKRYHVFLSFRGPDVRKTLVDHLFHALSTAGLNIFIDSDKLEKGEIIELSLERAIESSVIRIPIFSKGYADSTWCLKEAAAMLSTPGLIIPLFYHMDPTDVRYPDKESSPYKQSFHKHYCHSDRYPKVEIDGWKNALREICKCSGWSMDITQGYEAQLVKMVVNDLIKTFDRVPLAVAKHPVGMDTVKNYLIQKLNLNSAYEVVKVGIWGIGGIGKTTVAKALYNQVYAHFEAASFVFNVRATAADHTGLTNLQKQILKNLTKNDKEVDSVAGGISLFRDRLGGKRVLLILDDVDAVVQLNALVGDWLAPGSRVILTSRDKHILDVAGVSSECIHEMSGLEKNEGLQLFSWHAFLGASPSPSYEDLSKKIVDACKGHPLSLEVIGSFLYGKENDRGCWIEALGNITRNPEIHERLHISYRALTDDEKEIFLDIACFFIGEHKRFPIMFWKSLYEMVDTAVLNLSMKLLIKIDNQGVFDMHDHLRDMGRIIAEREEGGTRLWKAAHLIFNDIKFSRLRLHGGNPQRLEMLYTTGLRYLHLRNVSIEGMTENTLDMLPPSLIWLRLENCHIGIGKNILTALKNILTTPWEPRRSRFASKIWQLKIMQVVDDSFFSSLSLSSLFSLPNIQLQHVDLRLLKNLKKLPDTIGNLSQLQHLNLEGCWSLISLPDSIGNLSQLQHMSVKSCSDLISLPDSIGNLSQLQHMSLEGCKKLKKLPDSIGNLSQLQHMSLEGCQSLISLPDSIGNLSQLQHMSLEGCWSFISLPDSIGNLSQLQHMSLERCFGLISLPDSIGNLSQLQHMSLERCYGLISLPDTIGNLSQLQHLNLEGCSRLDMILDSIDNLSQLQHLSLKDCSGLNNLPDSIGNLSQLQHMSLEGCKKLKNLPDSIGNLSQLQHMSLEGCQSLISLPDSIGNLSQLQHMSLERCYGLISLPDTIGNLSQLQHLNLEGCSRLDMIPDSIGNLSQLQHLSLKDCSGLNNLPDSIGNLSQLQHMSLEGCRKLKKLPDSIGNLSQLQHMSLEGCWSLNSLPHSISNLSLKDCSELNNFPHTIGNLSQLQHLYWFLKNSTASGR